MMGNRHLGIRLPGRQIMFWLFLGVLGQLLSGCIPVTGDIPTAKGAQARGALEKIQASGVIVVATDPNYPPQSELHPDTPRLVDTLCDPNQYTHNQVTGFDIDVAAAVAEQLGVEACFVAPAWSQIVSGSWAGRWDISVGSMVITRDRMQYLYFTQPYTTGEAVAFVHQDNQDITSLTDLSGKRIGVCAGCAYEAYLRGALDIPGVQIENLIQDAVVVGYDTDTSALADLAAGNGETLDAVLTDPDTGQAAISQGLPVRQIEGVVYHDFVAIAVDRQTSSDPEPLVSRLTAIIQSLHEDGTLTSLSESYYGGDFTRRASEFDVSLLGQFQ